MRRSSGVVMTAVCLSVVCWASMSRTRMAEEAAETAAAVQPPWQRNLQGEDARQADEQAKQVAELQEAGRFEDALKVAETLAELRTRIQGADHWQAIDVRFVVEAIRGVLRQPMETRQEYASLFALSRQAAAFGSKGRYKEAQPLLAKILSIYRKVLGEEHPDTATSYNNLAGNQNAQGKYTEAEEGYRKALDIFRKVLGEEHPDTATSYRNLAYNLYKQGQYDKAEALLLLAAKGFSTARIFAARSGLERAATPVESPLPLLAAVLARRGQPANAWQWLEQGLGRGTLDEFTFRSHLSAEEQQQLANFQSHLERIDRQIKQSVASTPTQIQACQRQLLDDSLRTQKELATFRQSLEQKYGRVAGKVLDRAAIQRTLARDIALITWLDIEGQPKAADPNGEHWAILLRRQGEPIWVRLRGSGPGGSWTAEDDSLPKRMREALVKTDSDWQRLAARLREQRLTPLESHLQAHDGLPAVSHLVVLPSSSLVDVPIEVFTDDKYVISYAPSASLHAHLRSRPAAASRRLLAVGDAVFNGKLPPLPGSRYEVERLQSLANDASPTVLLGSDASEQNLYAMARSGELGRYRHLLFSTHGLQDRNVALRSRIFLSVDALPDPLRQREKGEPVFDGEITAEEVLRTWRLDSELVTLSACQSAQGKYESGEGHVGFAQALLLAGSRSVCVTQWSVSDVASCLLMERFYQNVLGKRVGLSQPLGKAEALREAKHWLRTLSKTENEKLVKPYLEYMQRLNVSGSLHRGPTPQLEGTPPIQAEQTESCPYAHPYYWAAFVLIGDDR